MNRFLALLLACALAPVGTQASAQSISIGPNGISLSGVPSSVRGQSSVSVQLDSSGIKFSATASQKLKPPRPVPLRTVWCSGAGVLVRGDSQHLYIAGECSQVVVRGNRNIIKALGTGRVDIQGDDNKVTISGPLSEKVLLLAGHGNRVLGTLPPSVAPVPLPLKLRPKPAPRAATRL